MWEPHALNVPVLFLMPNWRSVSETWLQRMIRAVESDVAAVAAMDTSEPRWEGRIPSVRLVPQWAEGHLPHPLARFHSARGVRLIGAMRRHGVDRVLAHYLDFADSFRAVWSSTSAGLYVHCHGYDVTWDLRRHDSPGVPFFPRTYPSRVRRLADRAVLIANSRTTAEKLRSIGVPPERIEVKYLGVPVPATFPERASGGGPLRLLYVGRLVDFKGPDVAIQAFDLACRQGLDGRLVIAGDGPLRSRCEDLRQQSRYGDRIVMTGPASPGQVQQMLAEADVFTAHNIKGPLTRQEEALGVSVIEAMAAGLPVVSGASGSLPEVVEDGVTGLLVLPGDVEAHAAAFLTLSGDAALRSRMGLEGWRRASERFTAEAEAEALRRILRLP